MAKKSSVTVYEYSDADCSIVTGGLAYPIGCYNLFGKCKLILYLIILDSQKITFSNNAAILLSYDSTDCTGNILGTESATTTCSSFTKKGKLSYRKVVSSPTSSALTTHSNAMVLAPLFALAVNMF